MKKYPYLYENYKKPEIPRSVYEKEAKKQQQDGLAAVSFVADMVPVVSNVKGGWEASVGYDPITGNELSHFDRSVSGAGIVFGGFARVPGKVVKYGSEGAEYVLRVNKAEKTVTKHKVKDVSKGESKAVEKVEERGRFKEESSGSGDKGKSNSVPSYGKKSVPIGPYREVNGFPAKVKPGAQEKHIPNTPNYKQEIANGKNKSIFYGDNKTAQELLDKFAGKGQLLPNGKKERLDFGKPIGKYYDRDTGEYLETTRGMIHYGKDGAHIVPSEPLKK